MFRVILVLHFIWDISIWDFSLSWYLCLWESYVRISLHVWLLLISGGWLRQLCWLVNGFWGLMARLEMGFFCLGTCGISLGYLSFLFVFLFSYGIFSWLLFSLMDVCEDESSSVSFTWFFYVLFRHMSNFWWDLRVLMLFTWWISFVLELFHVIGRLLYWV